MAPKNMDLSFRHTADISIISRLIEACCILEHGSRVCSFANIPVI